MKALVHNIGTQTKMNGDENYKLNNEVSDLLLNNIISKEKLSEINLRINELKNEKAIIVQIINELNEKMNNVFI